MVVYAWEPGSKQLDNVQGNDSTTEVWRMVRGLRKILERRESSEVSMAPCGGATATHERVVSGRSEPHLEDDTNRTQC